MNLRALCRWNTPDIDALTISSSTYSGQLLPIICSQRSRASMCKGPLTHSLHCSEFVELTLRISQIIGGIMPKMIVLKAIFLIKWEEEKSFIGQL